MHEEWEPAGPSAKETSAAVLLAAATIICFPIILLGGFFFFKSTSEKPEAESLEAAIKSVGTKIQERNDCDQGVQGYYLYEKEKYNVISDTIVICTNNFSKTTESYPRLLKHEITHIIHACLGTTINSPDEIRSLREELKKLDETSYREIHGTYTEKSHFQEIEARWMEHQDATYVNLQLQKYCQETYR